MRGGECESVYSQPQSCKLIHCTDLHVSPLALLPFGCLLGIAQPFCGGPFEGVKVPLVAGQLSAVQVQDVGADNIQEISSMRHHHQCFWPFAEVVLQQVIISGVSVTVINTIVTVVKKVLICRLLIWG